jgi:hypothetical protein
MEETVAMVARRHLLGWIPPDAGASTIGLDVKAIKVASVGAIKRAYLTSVPS